MIFRYRPHLVVCELFIGYNPDTGRIDTNEGQVTMIEKNEFGTYNKVYGTIGAFAILMAWLYFTSLILLIGGAINNQTLDKLSSDKLPEIQD